MTAAAIVNVLGGEKTLKRKVKTEADLHVMTREGLPVETLPRLAAELGVERKRLAKVVGISERTLSRRVSSGSKMSAGESDRTMRVARVMAHAARTLGTVEKAARWLQRPNLSLGNEAPLELLDTDAGSKSVEDVLIRIEFGVFS